MADLIYPTGIIYKITNTINGNFYVGKTTQPIDKRWTQHRSEARTGSQAYLHRAIRKYGESNFVIEVVHSITNPTTNVLNEWEVRMISELNPRYNMTIGGEGAAGHIPSTETRDKLSAVWTKEKRLALSNIKKGKRNTPEQIAKQAAAIRGRTIPREYVIKRMNKIARWWQVTTPEHNTINIHNLSLFCRTQKSRPNYGELVVGHPSKGYTAVKLSD